MGSAGRTPAPAARDHHGRVRDIVCPFCSLACDDLELDVSGRAPRLRHARCSIAEQGFGRPTVPAPPRMGGAPVHYEQAIERAAHVLSSATQPLISGLGTDVNGCRQALALAERCGAVIDAMHSGAGMANLLTLQSRGWFMTTLTEVRNRADFVLLVGSHPDSACPRFSERILAGRPRLSARSRKRRYIAGLGIPGRDQRPPLDLDVRCSGAALLDTLSALRAELGRGPASSSGPRVARGRTEALARLADAMRRAAYGVVVWAPAALPPAGADLVVDALCELVALMNETTRFGGLSLGGHEGGTTFANVCTWQSGYPCRVRMTEEGPEHDPLLFAADEMLRTHTADALLWVSSFSASRPVSGFRGPVVAVTIPSSPLAGSAEVFLPVATPGVHHGGTLFRTDSVVGLPLRGICASPLPSTADVLSDIRKAI